MVAKACQYTLRNVPVSVDRALRQRAQEQGRSLNAFLLDVLKREVGADGSEPALHRDLDEFVGSWVPDPAVEQALKSMRNVDPRDWE